MLPAFPEVLPADPVFQKLHVRLEAEGRMLPFLVVEHFDVLKGGCPEVAISQV